jgi:hypothetical protein
MAERVFYQHIFAPQEPVVLQDEPLFPRRVSFRVDDLEWPPWSAPAPELKAKLRIEIRTPDGWRLATDEEKDMVDARAPRTFRWVWDADETPPVAVSRPPEPTHD